MLGKLGLCPQPSPDFVEDTPLVKTETHQFSRKKLSVDKTHGSGIKKIAKPATRAVAPTVLKVLYIADVNNGNTDPNQYLTKPLL